MNLVRRLILLLAACSVMQGYAQRAAVSTDAVKWLSATPNFTVSAAVTTRITLEMECSFNPFGELYPDTKFTHVAVSPQVMYWFKRPYYSHSLGVNAVGSIYDVRVDQREAKGRMAALGLVYGYGFILSTRMAITPSIGVGYGAFKEATTGVVSYKPTVTKIGVTFSYIID